MRSTSSPSAGEPSMRSIAPANTHGCRPKNGCARLGLRITFGAVTGASQMSTPAPSKRRRAGACGYCTRELQPLLHAADVRQRAVGLGRLAPAVEHRADAQQQLGLVDRLRDEVVGPG